MMYVCTRQETHKPLSGPNKHTCPEKLLCSQDLRYMKGTEYVRVLTLNIGSALGGSLALQKQGGKARDTQEVRTESID